MAKYQKFYAICGMLSPIVFNLIWIIAGFIQPGYDHIRNDVSSLMALGAPNKLMFDLMNIVSFILEIIFFIGLIIVMKELNASIVGPAVFLAGKLLGILVPIFFPLNYGGLPTGFTGTTHLIIVMITGFIALAGMIVMWRGLKKVDKWKGYSLYSLITFILTLIFTMWLVFVQGTEIMGLAERFVIIINGQYTFVLAIKTFQTSK
ncbi:MAG: DUF998 domain-containing protein [Candidatus Hermodarchaeota archaeon]